MPWIRQSTYKDLLEKFGKIEKRSIVNDLSIKRLSRRNKILAEKIWELEKKNIALSRNLDALKIPQDSRVLQLFTID